VNRVRSDRSGCRRRHPRSRDDERSQARDRDHRHCRLRRDDRDPRHELPADGGHGPVHGRRLPRHRALHRTRTPEDTNHSCRCSADGHAEQDACTDIGWKVTLPGEPRPRDARSEEPQRRAQSPVDGACRGRVRRARSSMRRRHRGCSRVRARSGDSRMRTCSVGHSLEAVRYDVGCDPRDRAHDPGSPRPARANSEDRSDDHPQRAAPSRDRERRGGVPGRSSVGRSAVQRCALDVAESSRHRRAPSPAGDYDAGTSFERICLMRSRSCASCSVRGGMPRCSRISTRSSCICSVSAASALKSTCFMPRSTTA